MALSLINVKHVVGHDFTTSPRNVLLNIKIQPIMISA